MRPSEECAPDVTDEEDDGERDDPRRVRCRCKNLPQNDEADEGGDHEVQRDSQAKEHRS